MKTSLRVPSISGREWKPGALMTVNPGTWRRSASRSVTGRNMFRANRACHAISVMTRIGSRCVSSAPTWQSWTKSSLPSR